MIIDKVADFARTNQSSKELLKKYIDLSSRPVDNLIELSKLSAELCKIREKLINQYILSFNGNEEAILADVKEILSKIEKKDFTDEIAIRKRLLPSKENIEKAKEESNAREVILYIKKAEQEAKANYKNFYDWILLNALKHQLKALLHYKLPTDKLESLAAEKAESFYKKPKSLSPIDSNAISLAAANDKFDGFNMILQGTMTNPFAHIVTNSNKCIIDKDRLANKATIRTGGYTLVFENYFDIGHLKTSTQQLLDLLVMKLTESGCKSLEVAIPLDEYMQERGLKDKKEARKQVNEDLEVLFNAKQSYQDRKGRKGGSYLDMRLIEAKGIQNGIIKVSFAKTFFDVLKERGRIMPYHKTLLSRNNKNSYSMGRKIAEHKNMNYGKANENIISVRTLLSVAPYIPSYDEVMQSDRHLNQRIIEPFERNMDALTEAFSWEYCKKNGEKLTEREKGNLDYILFESLNVLIHWHNYPDEWQKERLATKQKQQKERMRKSRAKKKIEDKNTNT